MANPLLSMLKSAAGGPSPASPSPASVPAGPAGSTGSSGSGPSTTSPPPNFQPVSLDDLFKSISQPTPPRPSGAAADEPAAPAHAGEGQTTSNHVPVSVPSTTTPPSTGSNQAQALATSPPGQHQAKLLGMLSLGVGTGSNPSTQATPELSRPASGPQPNRDDQRRASLLNMLRSPPAATAPALAEPVITHPAPTVPAPPSVISPPPANVNPGGLGSIGQVVTPPHAPTTPAGPTPAKSPFDFVSPFDAFEKPSSKAPSVAAPTAPASIAPSAASAAAARTPSIKSLTPSAPSSPAKHEHANTPPAAAAASPASQAQQTVISHARHDSSGLATKKEGHGPSLASRLLKGAEGTGPCALPPGGITIDMSMPNLDTVVNGPGSFKVNPATIMKAESVAFSRGRSVGAAGRWVAYTLSRGRIRLIDMSSGARTLIQLEATGPVLDLAVTEDAVAVVLSDGSVNAYSVPTSWEQDDPDCPLIFRLPPIAPGTLPADKSLGDINQIEWVKRDNTGNNRLAIGGTEGAVIIKPSDWGHKAPLANAREMLTNHRVLKTSGLVVQFCLNATHQAIGLISSSGYFCLYSVASLNKVWHRQLPSSNTSAPLSSVRFCEALIMVGRANDTMFDLVQITYELAVITTIKFNAPESHPLSFGQAIYDSQTETLFVSQFARGSIYAFRYKLKGTQPLRGVTGPDATPVLAFDAMEEFPAEPVVSLVMGPSAVQDPVLLFASPTGISQLQINKTLLPPTPHGETPAAAEKAKPIETDKDKDKDLVEKLTVESRRTKKAAAAEKRAQSPLPGRQAQASQETQSSQRVTRSPVKTHTSLVNSLSAVSQDEKASHAAPATSVPRGSGITADDIHKALKKTEDKLSSQIKSAIQAEFGSAKGGSNLPTTITSAVTGHLQNNLPKLVEQELQRVVPGAVQAAVREQAPAAIHHSLQNIGRDVERVLAPIVPRTLNTVVQPAVERAVRDAIQQALIPALDAATTRVYDQLASDLKSEMVQIRKDVVAEQGEALEATNDMLHTLSGMVESLQRQVAALTARSPAAGPIGSGQHTARSVMSPPAVVQPPQNPMVPTSVSAPALGHAPAAGLTQMAPAPVPGPSQWAQRSDGMMGAAQDNKQLEDTFLAALGAGSAPATLKLVHDFASRTDQILPARPARSPLSQAVLLTLVHRLSTALAPVQPHDPFFQTVTTWLSRAVDQLDPRDPGIAEYLPRVTKVVTQELGQRVQQLARYSDPLSNSHASMLRHTIDVLNSKQA